MAVAAKRIRRRRVRARSYPAPTQRRGGRSRRAVDIAAALLLLVMCAPILLAGMIAVWIGSGRPVLFGHIRLGRNGRPFRCWKLRTMHPDAERALDDVPGLRARYVANGYKLPLRSDPRVTSVGRILRRTYIDELPQLFNVLGGTMSLIGPRPIVPSELSNYGRYGQELLRERPGIIGAWTSRGRARPPYPERARLELDYIRNRTLRRDLAILLRAFPVILRGQPEDA
jgi:exopolysaccharide production protein ExoY